MLWGCRELRVLVIVFIPSFFFFFFFRVVPMAYEVPRLRVKLELQLPAYTTFTAIQDMSRISTGSVTYTTAHCKARSLTH